MRTRVVGVGPWRRTETVLEREDITDREAAVANFLYEKYAEVNSVEDYYEDACTLVRLARS